MRKKNHQKFVEEINTSNWKLQKLSAINFLTGENGSGKSLLLKHIFETYPKSYWLADCLEDTDNNPRKFNLGKRHNLWLSDFNFRKLTQILPEVETMFYAQPGPERGAYDKLIRMCKQIFLQAQSGYQIFLIEEPEIHLHPKLQKTTPIILQKLVNYLDIQFFVETHSPFIISSSGDIESSTERACRINREAYFCKQKTYFVSKGKIVDRQSRATTSAQYGYWSAKVKTYAAKMLGTGLGDFIRPLSVELTKDRPTVVFCEGQGQDSDAVIYNQIFDDRKPPVLFVSARGSSQLETSFRILKEIESGLSANVKFLMLRDRDHEFPSLRKLEKFEKINPGYKVLRLRAIEMYLYHPEIVSNLLAENKLQVNPKIWRKFTDLHKQIQTETETGIAGNSYKTRLEDMLFRLLAAAQAPLQIQQHLKLELTKQIQPNTTVYQQLEALIFD